MEKFCAARHRVDVVKAAIDKPAFNCKGACLWLTARSRAATSGEAG